MVSSVFGSLLLAIPALSLLSIEALDFPVKLFLLVCLLLGIMVMRLTRTQDSNIFAGSGDSEPALFSQELTLRNKGGRGNGYFLDSSVGFASIDDFNYTPGRSIDFCQLLKEKGDVITPYCVDDEHRQIVFVETEPGFDPAQNGTYFQSQRKHAIKLYTVPYAEYHSVVSSLKKTLTSTKNVLLLYNTSRCGTGLFSQCLSTLTQMQSISEPDIFTSLANIASESYGTRNAEIIALVRSSTKLLCFLHRKRNPEYQDICLKFRFQVMYIADLVQKAIPDSKSVFLYRNGLDVVDSMSGTFIKNDLFYQFIHFLGLDVLYLYYLSNLTDHLWKLIPLMKDTQRFPQSSYKDLGFISLFIMGWLSVMHKAMEAIEAGDISVAIRYNDLVKQREALVCEVLNRLDFPATSKRSCRKYRRGSNPHLRIRHGYVGLSDKDIFDINAIIIRHNIETPDFVIPGTLSLD